MAAGGAAPSTFFASMVFHCAPNAAIPGTVIRSTTSDGTSVGAICGGDVGGGAWADAPVAIIIGIKASAAPATSLPRSLMHICPPICLRCFRHLHVETALHETCVAAARGWWATVVLQCPCLQGAER